jgi:catechol 2,3-dioxygenase-like lactoylglutathione lyase family enzyme
MTSFPLSLGRFDHYTLIVPDVQASTRFHMDILGFGWVREQKVNAGSAPEGEHDMLNHVLHFPGDPSRVVVITEGLTEDSIFSKYLAAHGPGIHHVAYTVDDLAGAFAKLEAEGIPMTSSRIVHDPLSGLRQVFLSREKTGYFIELIERTEAAEEGTFKEDNMAELANTMKSYIGEDESNDPVLSEVVAVLPVATDAALDYLSDPAHLGQWTAHQTVMQDGTGAWVERRLIGDVPLEVTRESNAVRFTWTTGEGTFSIRFSVENEGEGSRISVPIPEGLPEERARRTAAIIACELTLLTQALGIEVDAEEVRQARREIGKFHLEVYARTGA